MNPSADYVPFVAWPVEVEWALMKTGQVLIIMILLLLTLAFILLFDRKVWAAVQLRKGPNVVGPFGLFQSFADFLKFVLKEIVIPSNSKYPFLGGLRSAAQMVSYEVSIGFIIITVLLLVGSLNLTTIVDSQANGIWMWHAFRILNFAEFPANILVGVTMIAMFVMFFVSALAETNRPPFDLPEAESELVAGYQVEYSSTPYLLFMIGEYLNTS